MTSISDLSPTDFETDLVGRPWLSRQMARARAAWPRGPLSVSWPDLGELRMLICGLAPIEHQSTAGVGQCESFALWRSGRLGRLDVDARFAVAASGLALGISGALPLSRMLSPAERGAMAAIIGLVLDATLAPLAVAIEPPDAVPLRLDFQVELDLCLTPSKSLSATTTLGPVVGWARLFLPWSWFEAGAALWSNLARVPFPVALEVARTQLGSSALASLQVGDALVFDGHEYLSNVVPYSAILVVGAFSTLAEVSGAAVRLLSPFSPMGTANEPMTTLAIAAVPSPWKATGSMSSTVEMTAMPATALAEGPSASLNQALINTPVEVVAEIGRLVLTGAELAGLEQGEVFSLGTASKGTITLSVAGRPVAKGALVNIDGTFGVRVTERY